MVMNNIYSSYREFEENKLKCHFCDVGKVYNRVVASEGNKINPIVIIIGEACGAEEIEQGKPFVGRSGRLLRDTLNKHGFRKSNALITNTIPCRPLDNKFPKDEKLVKKCVNKWLINEINLLNPKALLLVGSTPLKYVMQMGEITKNRGEWLCPSIFTDKSIMVLATFHPSYVLRKAGDKNVMDCFSKDIQTVSYRFLNRENSDRKDTILTKGDKEILSMKICPNCKKTIVNLRCDGGGTENWGCKHCGFRYYFGVDWGTTGIDKTIITVVSK